MRNLGSVLERISVGLPLIALAVLACGQDAPPPTERPGQDVMRGAPIYLPSRAVEQRSTADAAETEFHSPDPVATVADWYRDRVDAMGWDLIGDAPSSDGGVVLHVEREGPPLWIVIRPSQSGEGTVFSLIGAVPRRSEATDSGP